MCLLQASIILCVGSSLCFLATSQAPGDGDEYCLSLPSHPVYDSYIYPLMDTRDYIQLIVSDSDDKGGVWQTLDRDTNMGQRTWWQRNGNDCVSSLVVCGYEAGPQNNWLISQHISRQVLHNSIPVIQISFDSSIFCPSDPYCVKALSLYVWETSTPNATSAADTDNYHFITNLYSGVQQRTIDFSSSHHTGFYLGIRDNGTCATVNRVLVYYTTCGPATIGLVGVNETVFNSSSVVQGECVADSVAIHEEGPLVVCSEKGEWSIVSDCECSTQHYMDTSGPKCLESPPAPVNVSLSNVTNTSATVSWMHPVFIGGRMINYTVTYSALSSTIPVVQLTEVAAGQIELTELAPFHDYVVSVTSEVAVSSQDSNVTARTTTTTFTTLEGVAAKVRYFKLTVGDDVTLSWSQPDPPRGVILFYNIRFNDQQTLYSTVLTEYTQNSITKSALIQSLNVTNEAIIVLQVQAVTRAGAGIYSDPMSIVGENTTCDTARVGTGEYSDPVVSAVGTNSDRPVIVLTSLLVPALLLLCALVIVLIVIILKLKKKLKQLKTRRNNKSLEYASTIIIPVTGAPVLPRPPSTTWKFSENVAYVTTGSSNENEYDTVGEMGSDEVINNTYIDFIGTGQ